MTVVNYVTCAFTDPGFMPRSSPDETINTEKQNQITTDMSGFYYPSPKNRTIEIRNCEYEMKFCVKIEQKNLYFVNKFNLI